MAVTTAGGPHTGPSERPRKQEAEPASAEITEVAPKVLRLQLPIQMPGLGHVNCYALEDADGFALVDPGMPGPQSWKAFESRIASAGIPLHRVHTVVVTHSHVDHFGASGRIRQKSGAAVVTHRSIRTWWDITEVDDPESLDDPGWPTKPHGKPQRPWERKTPWGGEHPRPPRMVRIKYTVLRPLMKRWMAAPQPSKRLEDADTITLAALGLAAALAAGHTPDHLCLFDPAEGVLLSGDHVLPSITPHISGVDAGPDPLTAFFESLDRMHELDGVQTVLPAHGHPFTDLPGRVEGIKRHHAERLQKLRDAASELGEAPVEEYARRLFSPRVWGPMADSETYAHLEHLRLGGEAERRDHNGRLHYSFK